MHLLRLSVLSLFLLILAACGGGDEGDATPEGSATAGSDGSPGGGSASGGGSVELLPGVVWERVDGPASGVSTALNVFALEDGFAAFGQRWPDGTPAQPGSAQGVGVLAAWSGDAEGAAWSEADVGAVPPWFEPRDVAHRDGTIVAVGTEGVGCANIGGLAVRRCEQLRAHVIWSTDGGASWRPATAPPGDLGTNVSSVVATADGFVAIGRDEAGGVRWELVVWQSSDGQSWREVSRFADERWPMTGSGLEVVGESIWLSGSVAHCADTYRDGEELTLTTPRLSESRLWSTTDPAAGWEELDLVAAGLIDGVPAGLDCDNVSETRGEAATRAWFLPRAIGAEGEAIVGAASGLWRSSDGRSWERFGDLQGPTQQPWRIHGVPGGWVAVDFEGVSSAVLATPQTSVDLEAWTDWSMFSPPLPPVIRITSYNDAGISSAVGDLAALDGVVVAVGADRSEGTPAASFYRSGAATVSSPPPDCEPAAGLECPRGDFANDDLAGVNLSGANLVGADLGGADLSGANLSGANLEDANLEFADLTDANLSGARLVRARFNFAEIDGADFTNADLTNATDVEPLASATWTGAVLSGLSPKRFGDDEATWTLAGVDFTGSRLDRDQTGMSFAGATLFAATLRGDLTEADFTDADLSGASITVDLTGARFAGATWDDATFWNPLSCPDGFEPSSPGTGCEGHFIDR